MERPRVQNHEHMPWVQAEKCEHSMTNMNADIYKVIEIRVQISEYKFISYKNMTIWNDYYQYTKYDKNKWLGEYQFKETTLTLIWLNL